MSYATLKETVGVEPFQRVTCYQKGCSLTYGVAPCTASLSAGNECFNSWETCQDKVNYDQTDKVISFCTPVSNLPPSLTDLPFLEDVDMKGGEPDPMESIGSRTSLDIRFIDAVHDDTGIDPYVDTRTYDPLERGTFWPKIKARYPYWKNLIVEWEHGYLENGEYDAANFKKLTFIIDSLEGRKGRWRMKAKDPLRLLDDDKAKMPRPSIGVLTFDMAEGANPSTIDITTSDQSEYDIESYEDGFSAVRIGKEVFKYTGVTPISGGVRLTGVTTTLDDDYETETEDHDAEDEVQKCLWIRDTKSVRVVQIAMEEYGNINPAYVPYTDWENLHTTWQAGFNLTRLITEPEGVKKQLNEIIKQSGTWAYWWDAEANEIKFQPIRPPDFDEIIASFSERDHLVKDSVSRKDEPDRLFNEVYIVFGQRDPTKKMDEIGNYSTGVLEFDSDSISDNETGERKTKTIHARWVPANKRQNLRAIASKMINAGATIPFTIEFELHKKDDYSTADFVSLESALILDQFGATTDTRLRIIRGKANGQVVKYKAIEEFFRARFGRWAPSSLSGLTYAAATDSQRSQYIFWADASGKMSDNEDGYRWL